MCKKKTILLTTVHPAPYVDRWINVLKQKYNLTIAYHEKKSKMKSWKTFHGYEGFCFSDFNIVAYLSLLKNYDFVIFGGWYNLYTLIGIFYLWILNRKFAVFSDYPDDKSLKRKIYYIKKYMLFKLIPYFFCATESCIKFYSENYSIPQNKLKLFQYIYAKSNWEKVKLINKQRQRQISEGSRINLFIANNFYYRKGYDVLVNAFQMLHEQNSLNRFSITIAGHGVDFEKIKNEILSFDPTVNFVGWIEPDKYDELMESCDIFIHASFFEPFGIPPLDAMDKGKLLIVSDGVRSVDKLIINGVNGFSYKANDSCALYEILNSINVETIYKIGEAGRNSLLSTYNAETCICSIEESI